MEYLLLSFSNYYNYGYNNWNGYNNSWTYSYDWIQIGTCIMAIIMVILAGIIIMAINSWNYGLFLGK